MRVLKVTDDLADSLWRKRNVHDEMNAVVHPRNRPVRLARVDVVGAAWFNGQLLVIHEPIVLQRGAVVQEDSQPENVSRHTGVVAMGHKITPCVASNEEGASQRLKRIQKTVEARAGMVDVSLFIELHFTDRTTQLMHGLRCTWDASMASTWEIRERQAFAVVRAVGTREVVNPIIFELGNLVHELTSIDVKVEWFAVTQIEQGNFACEGFKCDVLCVEAGTTS